MSGEESSIRTDQVALLPCHVKNPDNAIKDHTTDTLDLSEVLLAGNQDYVMCPILTSGNTVMDRQGEGECAALLSCHPVLTIHEPCTKKRPVRYTPVIDRTPGAVESVRHSDEVARVSGRANVLESRAIHRVHALLSYLPVLLVHARCLCEKHSNVGRVGEVTGPFNAVLFNSVVDELVVVRGVLKAEDLAGSAGASLSAAIAVRMGEITSYLHRIDTDSTRIPADDVVVPASGVQDLWSIQSDIPDASFPRTAYAIRVM